MTLMLSMAQFMLSLNHRLLFMLFKMTLLIRQLRRRILGFIQFYFNAYFNGIVVYNRNFTFKGYKSGLPYPRAITSVNNNNNVELFVSGKYSVFKLDINLYITASYFQDSTYKGLYCNKTGDSILICHHGYLKNYIQVFNRADLNFIKIIKTASYEPFYINEFKGVLYVSTTTGAVLRVVNEVSTLHFITACTSAISIAIDSFDDMAVLCQHKIDLYSINGTYLNVSKSISISNTYQIGFDELGNLIISAHDGIFIMSYLITNFNNTTLTTTSTSTSSQPILETVDVCKTESL